MIFRRKNRPTETAPARIQLSAPIYVSSTQTPAAPAKKILIVDDDPITLQAFAHKLRSKGYEVVTAGDASEALNVTRKERPDLMLLDVNLPPEVGSVEWNGFLVTQWLQRMQEGKSIPVIVMSASDRSDYKERALFAGATAFFCKLTDNKQLFASIESALRGHTAGAPKPTPVFEI
jgi:DNA-binding response OmpR family regulator